MLNADELNYLKKIPHNKKFIYQEFNTQTKNIYDDISRKINKLFPNITIIQLGASALGIGGQNDIDIYILAKKTNFKIYLNNLINLFGTSNSENETSIAWKFSVKGLSVELYLTDPNSQSMKRQLAVFKILNKNNSLRQEYDDLKRKLSGKNFKEYQKQKYIFYHRILD